MSKPLDLQPGRGAGNYDETVFNARRDVMKATADKYLGDFVNQIKQLKSAGVTELTIAQDAFAAGYHVDEFTLLGIAVKYAGLHGVTVTITGKNCGFDDPNGHDGGGDSPNPSSPPTSPTRSIFHPFGGGKHSRGHMPKKDRNL